MNLKDFVIVTGHYGCGKTNFSINLAIDYAKQGKKVTLVDMDIVNPYFRTSDYKQLLEQYNINVIAPSFGATNLDLPSLPAAMYGVFDMDGKVILDVGGDDVGATVLGRFNEKLKEIDYDMLYLINFRRSMTKEASDMVDLLNDIQAVSRTKATYLVNNSHLMEQTTSKLILEDKQKSDEVSKLTGLPLLYTTVPKWLYEKEGEAFKQEDDYKPVEIYVKKIWE